MKRNALIFKEMIQRYVDSLPYCDGKEVLDAGCRDGYGAHLISHVAKTITLVDKSPTCIHKLAPNTYKYLCGTNFQELDLEKTFPIGTFNTVLAFEIIEHLENPEFFIKNVAEHLYGKGYLIFSVPHMLENPVHKVLFDEVKIKNLINKYFIIKEFIVTERKHKFYFGVAQKI